MTVTKSRRPGTVSAMILLAFAMSQGLLLISSDPAQAQEQSQTSKSLLSFKFLKKQPSLLEDGNVSQTDEKLQDTRRNLPVIPPSGYAANGLTRMTANETPMRMQNRAKNTAPAQNSSAQDERGIARLEREIFNINTPPLESPGNIAIKNNPVRHAVNNGPLKNNGNNIVSVSSLMPLEEAGTDLLPEFRPLTLKKLSDEDSDFEAGVSAPRNNEYSLVRNMQNNEQGVVQATGSPEARTPVSLHDINASEMKSAMLNGVQPGVTTKAEVLENMGQPNQVQPIDAASEVLVYSLGELGNIEVTLQNGRVFSLVWFLPEPYPSAQIRDEGLGDELKGIRSIHVPDADGYILGQMFPEKGVIFSFLKADRPGEPSLMVNQIAIEPITSWPFELRGERYLTIANGKAKWDLTIAVQLDPNNDRARWLLAQAYLADGQLAEAQRECNFAIKLRADQPQYNVTLAEIIGKAGYTKEARQYLEYLLPYCENMPYLKGQVESLLGDFYRDDVDRPDLISAKEYHLAAINTVTPILTSENPTLRQRAKNVQMNAFLSMALNISMSDWKDKEKNLPQWLDGAEKLATNLVIEEKMSQDCLLNVALTAIDVYVNFPDLDGLENWIEKLEDITEEIISQSDDGTTIQNVEKKLATALYNIEQICEYRKDFPTAMQYAKRAVEYFERYSGNEDDVTSLYQLANLYYQMGRLEASGLATRPAVKADKKAHTKAVQWFAKAIQMFQLIEGSLDDYEQPVLGEIYVSIGVSYWMVGEKDYALQITEYGIGKLERAVDKDLIVEKVLATPYENLSTMYKTMGRLEEAENYYILSKQADNNVASGSSSTTTR